MYKTAPSYLPLVLIQHDYSWDIIMQSTEKFWMKCLGWKDGRVTTNMFLLQKSQKAEWHDISPRVQHDSRPPWLHDTVDHTNERWIFVITFLAPTNPPKLTHSSSISISTLNYQTPNTIFHCPTYCKTVILFIALWTFTALNSHSLGQYTLHRQNVFRPRYHETF